MNKKQEQRKIAFEIACTHSDKDLSVEQLIENAKLIYRYIFGKEKKENKWLSYLRIPIMMIEILKGNKRLKPPKNLSKKQLVEWIRINQNYTLDLKGVDLSGVNLKGVNLKGANLEDANLRGINLEGANLSHANLRGADLRSLGVE